MTESDLMRQARTDAAAEWRRLVRLMDEGTATTSDIARYDELKADRNEAKAEELDSLKAAPTSQMIAVIEGDEDLRERIASELHDLDLNSEERHLASDRIRDVVDDWGGHDIPQWIIDVVDRFLDSVKWQQVADYCVAAYEAHRWE